MKDVNVICFHGKPCAGKDTQAEILLNEFNNSIKISTGEIFRGAKNKEGEFAKYHETLKEDIEVVNAGGLIRDEVIIGIVGEVIKNYISEGKSTFIFTGFPRTVPQVDKFNQMLLDFNSDYHIKKTHFFLDISNKIAIERSQIRREEDILCNQKPRTEDEPIAFFKRLMVFDNLTLPMINQIKESEKLLTLDASKTINEISLETLTSLGILRSNKERR